MKRGRSSIQLDYSSHQTKEPKREEEKDPIIDFYEYEHLRYGETSIIKIDDTWWSRDGRELANWHKSGDTVTNRTGKFIWEYTAGRYGLVSLENTHSCFVEQFFITGTDALKEIEAYWGKQITNILLDTFKSMSSTHDIICILWSMMQNGSLDWKLSKHWNIWLPASVFFHYDFLECITSRGGVNILRYISKGGDMYQIFRQRLSKLGHYLVKDIIMGEETERILCALWAFCYIKDMPRDVFKHLILPELIWTEESYVKFLNQERSRCLQEQVEFWESPNHLN